MRQATKTKPTNYKEYKAMTTASETVKSSVRKSSGTTLREQRRQEAAKLQANIEAKKVIENTKLVGDPQGETLSLKVDLPKVANHASVKTAAETKAEFEAERRRQYIEDIHTYQPDFNGEGLTLGDLRSTLRTVKAEAAQKAKADQTPKVAPAPATAPDGKALPKKAAKADLPLCIECGAETGRHAFSASTVFCTWKCGHEWAMKQAGPAEALASWQASQSTTN